MKKRKGGWKILLGLFLIGIFLIFSSILMVSSESDGIVNTVYEGEWYSKGFSSFWNWKLFADTIINSLFKFIIIEKDNNYGAMIRLESGEEIRTPYFVNFNPFNGEMSGTLNYSLPGGEGKILSGKVLVNGQANLTKFFNPRDYINKTLRELILYGITNKLKVSFVGKESKTNIEVHPNSTSENPRVIINYQKFQPGDTSPIPQNYQTESINNTIITNDTIENFTKIISSVGNNTNLNISTDLSIQTTENKTNEINLSIINPMPSSKEIIILINETKRFSIENTDYDSIKWYLDEKETKKESKFYDFKGLKQGFYTLNVEVKKASKTSNYFWNIQVKKAEVKEESNTNWWIWIISGIVVILIIIAAIYFLKNRESSSEEMEMNGSEALPLENN